jgi:hypothetical protein
MWSGEAASMADARARTLSAARTAWSIMTPLPDPTDQTRTKARAWTGSSRDRNTHAAWIVMRAMRDAIGQHLRQAMARETAIALALARMDDHEPDPMGELATIRLPWLDGGTERHDTVATAGLGLEPPRHALEAIAALGLSAALAPSGKGYPKAINVVPTKFASATLRAAHEATRHIRLQRELALLDDFLRSHRGACIADEFITAGTPKG